MKPFAESCEQNKHVIFDVIKQEFAECSKILEIGSGTGQHAVYFCQHLLHLTWQPSEQAENIPGIMEWLKDYPHDNIANPIELNVERNWPQSTFDGVFSANTSHIMHWPQVIKMFQGIGQVLEPGGVFCLYGPFNYNQKYTSDSNRNFDLWLKEQDPERGIRDFDDLNELAINNQLRIKNDVEMPANNRILVWEKS